jgi:2'-5' RNA ligase
MRLFVAIDVPEEWRREAATALDRLAAECGAALRPVDAARLHVTVRFLGEVEATSAGALAQALASASVAACSLGLAPVGTFGGRRGPRVVWLGIDAEPSCLDGVRATIDRVVDGTLGASGAGEQPWRPHLTLARVRDRASAEERRTIEAVVASLPVPNAHRFEATTVALYRSHLGSAGPRYELLARSAV